jgi:conjugative relaxase-like TrwC/TraI family protein
LGTHLVANDYYEEGGGVVGVWRGRAAEFFGVAGQSIVAGDPVFEAFRCNRNPTSGEPLTARTRERRIAYYDFQCSAPKSVSVFAVTFGDDRLRIAHEQAVAVAFGELERFAGHRIAHDGVDKPSSTASTGNLVAACFTHDSSRELDAQLHTHHVVANATRAADGRWLALDNRDMYRAVGYAGRVYQNELAKRCMALGYEIREERSENGSLKGFEISGISQKELALQSTRRRQIEQEIERFRKKTGREPSAKERHDFACATRAPKLAEISTEAVRARQIAKYSLAERERISAVVETARTHSGGAQEWRPRHPSADTAVMAVNYAADHLLERAAVVSELDVCSCALANFAGRLELSDLKRAARSNPNLVSVGAQAPDTPSEFGTVTTRENLALERELVRIVEDGKGRCASMANSTDALSPELAADQREVLETILHSRDRVVAFRGPAGAGKTYALKAFGSALDAEGTAVLFVAPTHKAKQELQKEGFATADTVAGFLVELAAKRVSVAGKVLVVDEAGMTSTKDAAALLRAVTQAGARVVLVGDEKQLRSVEPGDTLRLLKEHSSITFAEMREIRRQRENPEYLRAAQALSEGRVRDGLGILDHNGWIKEGGGQYLAHAAADFLGCKDDAILVAPTWREVRALNDLIRGKCLSSGTLGHESTIVDAIEVRRDLTAAQRRDGRHYTAGLQVLAAPGFRLRGMKKGEWQAVVSVSGDQVTLANGRVIDVRANGARLLVGRPSSVELRVGDRVLLQQNDRTVGLTNGTLVTVARVEGSCVTVALDSGRQVVLPASYRLLTHGYAVTTEASQGATRGTAIFAAARADDVRRYVALTRGIRAVALHVPDKAKLLADAANEINGRPVALDFVESDRALRPSAPPAALFAPILGPAGGLLVPTSRARPQVLAAIGSFLRRLGQFCRRGVNQQPLVHRSPAVKPSTRTEPLAPRYRHR